MYSDLMQKCGCQKCFTPVFWKTASLQAEPSSLTPALRFTSHVCKVSPSVAEREIWHDFLLCHWGPFPNVLDTDTVLSTPCKGFKSLPTVFIPCIFSKWRLCNSLNKVDLFSSQDPSMNISGRRHVTETRLPNAAASSLGHGKAFCWNGKTKWIESAGPARLPSARIPTLGTWAVLPTQGNGF